MIQKSPLEALSPFWAYKGQMACCLQGHQLKARRLAALDLTSAKTAVHMDICPTACSVPQFLGCAMQETFREPFDSHEAPNKRHVIPTVQTKTEAAVITAGMSTLRVR